MLLTKPGCHSLLHGFLYITCVPISKKLLEACSWFLLVGFTALACGLLPAACPNSILAASNIGRSNIAFLVHSSSIGDCKPLPSGVFLNSIRAKGFFSCFLCFGQQVFHKFYVFFCQFIELMVMY